MQSTKTLPAPKSVSALDSAAKAAVDRRQQFLDVAEGLNLAVAGQTILAMPNQFSTGSVGWQINQKLTVRLPDGTLHQVQFSGSMVVSKSKEWTN